MDKVKQKVQLCNQRIANLTEHVNNTDAQISQVNAILREQSQSITMLTGAMPGVANLRTTNQNDVASKLRANGGRDLHSAHLIHHSPIFFAPLFYMATLYAKSRQKKR